MARAVKEVRVLDQVEVCSLDQVRLKRLPDAVTLPGGGEGSKDVTVVTTGDECVHCYGPSNRKVTCHCTCAVLDTHITFVGQQISLLCCEEGGGVTSCVLPGRSEGDDNRRKKKKHADPESRTSHAATTPTLHSNEDIFSTLLDSRAARGTNTCPTSCQVVYNSSTGFQVSDRSVQNFCVIPNYVVTCSESPDGWDVSVFSHTGEKHELLWKKRIPSTNNSCTSETRNLPRLYVVHPPGQLEGHSQGHAAEGHSQGHTAGTLHQSAELFSALFGVSTSLLHCPMILLGLPDGRVCRLPLKNVTAFAKPAPAGQLYHLQQAVVSVHAVTLVGDQSATLVGDHAVTPLEEDNMLLLVGAEGKIVLVRAGKSASAPVFKEYQVPGPIVDSDCSNGKLVYSTGEELCVVTLNKNKSQKDKVAGVFPDMLVPQKYDLGQVLKVVVADSGDDEQQDGLPVLAVIQQGCLLHSTLSAKPTEPTLHIRHLLDSLGTTASRMAGLTHRIQEQNRRLKHLNLVAEIISGIRTGKTEPFKCTTNIQVDDFEAGLSRVTFCCSNVSPWTLHEGWRLLVQVEICDPKRPVYQSKIVRLQDFRPGSVEEVSLTVQMGEFPCQVVVTGTLCCQVERTGVLGGTGVFAGTGVSPGKRGLSEGTGVIPGNTGVQRGTGVIHGKTGVLGTTSVSPWRTGAQRGTGVIHGKTGVLEGTGVSPWRTGVSEGTGVLHGKPGVLEGTGVSPWRIGVLPRIPGVQRGTGVLPETPDPCYVGIPVCRQVLTVPESSGEKDMLGRRPADATSCILDILLQQSCQ